LHKEIALSSKYVQNIMMLTRDEYFIRRMAGEAGHWGSDCLKESVGEK